MEDKKEAIVNRFLEICQGASDEDARQLCALVEAYVAIREGRPAVIDPGALSAVEDP